MQQHSLAPGLLLSMPQLADPYFTRAVILMLEHNELGSFGLIVNQPSILAVSELVSTLSVEWKGDSEAAVFSGGPVMPGSGWVVHSGSEALAPADASLDDALDGKGTVRVASGLYVTTSIENIKLLATEPPAQMRMLLGYSGWSGGQLAREMSRGSWLHADIDNEILFDCPAEEMWQRLLSKMGINPESIVQSQGVH